jgi:hypothetical protein
MTKLACWLSETGWSQLWTKDTTMNKSQQVPSSENWVMSDVAESDAPKAQVGKPMRPWLYRAGAAALVTGVLMRGVIRLHNGGAIPAPSWIDRWYVQLVVIAIVAGGCYGGGLWLVGRAYRRGDEKSADI